jgi:hypothetical protein
MWFQSVLKSLEFSSARTRAGRARRVAPRKRPVTCKLLLELLEDRTVPSFLPAVTYPVSGAVAAVAVGDFNNPALLRTQGRPCLCAFAA